MSASAPTLGVPAGGTAPAEPPNPIVEAIAAQRRRQTSQFRAIFIVTWIVLVGAIVGWLFANGKIDIAFLSKWGPFILGGRPDHHLRGGLLDRRGDRLRDHRAPSDA